MSNDPSHKRTSEDPRVLARQVDLLYQGIPLSVVATVVVGAIVGYAIAPSAGTGPTWAWLTVVVLVAAGRGADLRRFRRTPVHERDHRHWLRRFTIGAWAAGAGWGFCAWFFFPQGDPEREAFIALALAGICAGAVTTLSARRRAIVPYVALTLGPLMLRFLTSGWDLGELAALLIVLFTAVILGAAHRIGTMLEESAVLRLEATDREAALAASRELLEQTGDLALVGGWSYSLEREEVSWTDQMYSIYEIDRSTPLHLESLLSFFGPEARATVHEAMQGAMRDNRPFDLEVPFRTALGRSLWVRAKGVPVLYDGRVAEVHGALQDITDQKREELELQKALDAMALLNRFTASPDSTTEEAIDHLLHFGVDTLGLPSAVMSRIEGETYTVAHSADPSVLEPGTTFRLGDTYCSATIEGTQPLASHHIGESVMAMHPAYEQLKLESYIAAPITVDGEPYGTLAFFGADPREWPFSQIEVSLVRLFAQWVGSELTRARGLEAVLQSEERFDLAVRGSSDGIWDRDFRDGGFYLSPRFKQLLGYSPTELEDSFDEWEQRLHPDDKDRMLAAIDQHLRLRDVYDVEYRCRHRSGEYRWFRARGQAVWDAEGNPVRMAGSVTDISSRKQDRDLLERAIGLQEAILDATPFGILSIDEVGRVRSMNRGGSALFDILVEDVIGLSLERFFHDVGELERLRAQIGEDARADVDGPFEAFLFAAKLGRVSGSEWTMTRECGSTFPAEVTLAPIRNPDGETIGFVGVFVDLTERKKVDRLKNEFVSTVSHELRTPLTSISGALSLMLKGIAGELPAQATTLLEMASRNSERLIMLINDILDMEKISADKMHFEMEVQDVMPLVEQALNANEVYGDRHGVSFEVGASLDDVRFEVDTHRFGQVMANLLSNAAKFSPEGGVVRVDVTRHERFVRVSVADNGQGIAEEFHDHLFDKFSQADGADDKELGGTGLGLSITKAIVEKMRGRITFDSAPGEGTTFHVDIPERRALAEHDASDAEGPRVLIIEDEPEVASMLLTMLSDSGFAPVRAHSARAARRLLSEEPFDAVTLDLTLGGESGLDLLEEIRQDPSTARLPVVVVSSTATAERARHRDADWVDEVAWVQKPLRVDDLTHALRRVLSGNRGALRVLHVEDDDTLTNMVSEALCQGWSFDAVKTVGAGREALRHAEYDLVLLDLGLPDGSGWDLMDDIGQNTGSPHVVVFSANEVTDLRPGVARTVVKGHYNARELVDIILDVTDTPLALPPT